MGTSTATKKAKKAKPGPGSKNLRPAPKRTPASEFPLALHMNPEAVKAINTEKWVEFIDGLAQGAGVKAAADRAGLSHIICYARRKQDQEFANLWDEAREIGFAELEDEAKRRAHTGVLEPVFYQGSECGHVRKYSDQLLMFLMQGNMDKYKKKLDLTHKGGISVSFDKVDEKA